MDTDFLQADMEGVTPHVGEKEPVSRFSDDSSDKEAEEIK